MHCSTRGFSVHYEFPELAQTHVHQVCDVIQPSHSLWSPSIVPNIRVFSNESVFHIRWPKYWSFSISPSNEYIQDWYLLGLPGLISLQSKGLSRVFSSTTVQKHQFFNVQLSLWSNSHIHTWQLEKPELWLDGLLSAFVVLLIISCLKTYTFCLKV